MMSTDFYPSDETLHVSADLMRQIQCVCRSSFRQFVNNDVMLPAFNGNTVSAASLWYEVTGAL